MCRGMLELLRIRNFFWRGGGRNKLVVEVRENPRASPKNETLVCVDSPVVVVLVG